MSLRRWVLPLLAALALQAGPPREISRPEPAPVVLSEGAYALDEAFAQAFALEERPDKIALRYANETWELDWQDWWDYRSGELDLPGLLPRIRILTKVAAAPAVAVARPAAAPAGLPIAWIAGGAGVLLVVAAALGITLGTRRKRPARVRAAMPPPIPAPLPPPFDPPPLPVLAGLHFLSGPLAGRAVPLGQGLRLGRERDCHVVVDDRSVSRHHADLVPGPQGWILRDLGSSNGTSVNGQRIQGEALLRGDEILQFGNVKARLGA